MLILDGIFITIYFFLYLLNPEFRESEKLRRELEKNNNYKREESILSENIESKEKIFNIKITEISKNKNLIKNCLDDGVTPKNCKDFS